MNRNRLADLPQVEKLLEEGKIKRWFEILSRPVVTDCVKEALTAIRKNFSESGTVPDRDGIIGMVCSLCSDIRKESLQRVINGSGIILHTNLGRSPLPEKVWEKARDVNTGYSNLEFDLRTGRRGKRGSFLPRLVSKITGSESALVVNNNAAAVFLLLSSLAKGKEVIVSRGEQIQIGGGFRIPEILALSGAVMVEVGTTNITTEKDYLDAITENTAIVLLVHTSNFRIRGFTESPDAGSLSKALPENIILAVDQGSGIVSEPIKNEESVSDFIRKGADLVCFSGDKVLGGPQAGIITGRKKYIDIMKKNPMMRTFRTGKTVCSLLEQVLIEKLNKNSVTSIEKSLQRNVEQIRQSGELLLSMIPRGFAELVPSICYLGGGSAPDEEFPSWAIMLVSSLSPEKITADLRDLEIPIIATIKNNSVFLDLSTLAENDFPLIADSLKRVLTA